MKYSTSYRQLGILQGRIDEIHFSVSALALALDYQTDHPDIRIIIDVGRLDVLPENLTQERLFKICQEQNFSVNCLRLEDIIVCATSDYTFKYMYGAPASTWGLIQILTYYNVSDILIGEPFLFQCNKIIKNIKKKNPDIIIRAHPSIGQPEIMNEMTHLSGINHGWILPQHVHLYEDFIDVLELLDSNELRESALIEIYSKPSYDLALKLLIKNCSSEVMGQWVDEKWVLKRLNCEQKCIENSNACHYCFMEEAGFKIIREKRKALQDKPEFN